MTAVQNNPYQGVHMKKIFFGLLVVILGAIGFNKLASALDRNISQFTTHASQGDECGNNLHQ